MDFAKLSKSELLSKCEELGITKCKSKNKCELIELIKVNSQLVPLAENKCSESVSVGESVMKVESYELVEELDVSVYNPRMVDNSKLINKINQILHNNGVRQEERFNVLIELLEKNKMGVLDERFVDVIAIINSLDYSNCDLIQEIFMTIGSKYTKFNLNQFYTPLTISKFITNFMEIGEGYNAIDPAGGTGDLLLFYRGEKTVWDIDENALKLCKLNYELNRQSNYNLVCKNALTQYEDSESMYSYCVMNPPFGSNTVITDKSILRKFELGKGRNKQEIGVLFLELGLKLLKENGVLFVIVPAGYVGNGNKTCSEMRDLILKNRLIASISLPENTFKRSGTGVNTYLLIIQKTSVVNVAPYNVFISKVNTIGYNLTKKETPLKYKIIRESGEIVMGEDGRPILDNDLDVLYSLLCRFVRDNGILGVCVVESEEDSESEGGYEYINTGSLTLNILDIKRYLKIYLDVVDNLRRLEAVSLKSLCEIINHPTRIDRTSMYKYIDISEINSPLYGYKELYGWELPSRAKYTLRKYDILVSKLEGTMSYCVILDDTNNYIATNGVTVIRPNDMVCLYIIFSNIMSSGFRCQHNAYLTGSIMASLSDDDIGEFLIDYKTVDVENTKKILETLETLQRFRL